MGEGSNELNTYESELLTTKASRARAAAGLGRHLRDRQGIPPETAGDVAGHELKHALADDNPGRIVGGYIVDNETGRFTRRSAYQPDGVRSDKDQLRILRAPKDLSESDIKQISVLEKKRPWWKKILGLG